MLSKNKIKYLQSLKLKKFRQKYNKFIAEGEKIVSEILNQKEIRVEAVFATQEWAEQSHGLTPAVTDTLTIITGKELARISNLTTPNKVLAVVDIPEWEIRETELKNGLSLYLDGIRDPGNMGTILRIADWFGLEYLFCSSDSADIYQPKVVQSSMGAFLRIPTIRMPFEQLKFSAPHLTVYGTVLAGENMFTQQLKPNGIIIIGNESKGISPEVEKFIDLPIRIPSGPGSQAESLNAAVAAGIVCAVFRNLSI